MIQCEGAIGHLSDECGETGSDSGKKVFEHCCNKRTKYNGNQKVEMVFRIFPDHRESFQGVHRSGWAFALKALESAEMTTENESEGCILDTYVDRTFHHLKMEPYRVDWVGCIHHTFDTTHSTANNVELLKNENFLESLKVCKGLYVFSKYQKRLWELELEKIPVEVKVEVLVHPTELVGEDKQFSMESFLKNENRSIIQIGAWLRDMFAIYKVPPGLKIGEQEVKKKILKGPRMESYTNPDYFEDWLDNSVERTWGYEKYGSVAKSETGYFEKRATENEVDVDQVKMHGRSATGIPNFIRGVPKNTSMCRDSTKNKYVSDLVNYIKHLNMSVDIVNETTNEEYDDLLTKNMVMIRLVDASAVNTILECVARKTPIWVNRLEAVEEVLGKEYPLYYESVYEIPQRMTLQTIKKAHDYLKRIDETKFSDTEFIRSIRESEIYTNTNLQL